MARKRKKEAESRLYGERKDSVTEYLSLRVAVKVKILFLEKMTPF